MLKQITLALLLSSTNAQETCFWGIKSTHTETLKGFCEPGTFCNNDYGPKKGFCLPCEDFDNASSCEYQYSRLPSLGIDECKSKCFHSYTAASNLKSMLRVDWNAADTDTMKDNMTDIQHNFNQLGNVGDHPDAHGEYIDLQNRLQELSAKLQPSLEAWMQSPEAMDLQAKGQKFFEVRVDTKRNHKLADKNEQLAKNLIEPIDGDSSLPNPNPGRASNIVVRNPAIIDAARGEIETRFAVEEAVNSQEGQDVMGGVKATVENKEARDFGDAVEAGLNGMTDADPARRARLEKRLQNRAHILGQSIEKQLNFMGQTAKVTDTKLLETPSAQKVFDQANEHTKINTAGWK